MTANDDVLLINKVFQLKLKVLKQCINESEIFRKIKGYSDSIEFNKRDLTHA